MIAFCVLNPMAEEPLKSLLGTTHQLRTLHIPEFDAVKITA